MCSATAVKNTWVDEKWRHSLKRKSKLIDIYAGKQGEEAMVFVKTKQKFFFALFYLCTVDPILYNFTMIS